MTLRLLAVDLDGTLLDPAGKLRPAVRRCVAAVQARGTPVMVCTGRRYRTARPFLEALGLDCAAILQNGVLVKHARSGETLDRRYLARDLYGPALALLRESGSTPLVYVEHPRQAIDVVTEALERAHPHQQDYLRDNSAAVRFVDSLDAPCEYPISMLSCMGARESLLPLRERAHAKLGERIQTQFIINKNYRGHILEILSNEAGKWRALRSAAAELAIAPGEILAIGDDRNDAEMIEQAGVGVAMGNAVSSVKAVADYITGTNEHDGVVHAIERFLL